MMKTDQDRGEWLINMAAAGMSIDVLYNSPISTNSVNALKKAGLTTVRHVLSRSQIDLAAIPGCSESNVRKIKRWLKAIKLTLPVEMDPSDMNAYHKQSDRLDGNEFEELGTSREFYFDYSWEPDGVNKLPVGHPDRHTGNFSVSLARQCVTLSETLVGSDASGDDNLITELILPRELAIRAARAILELAGEGGDQKPPKLMNGLEVLAALGISGSGNLNWLHEKSKSGEIPHVKVGKAFRYSAASVESAILKMADGEMP